MNAYHTSAIFCHFPKDLGINPFLPAMGILSLSLGVCRPTTSSFGS